MPRSLLFAVLCLTAAGAAARDGLTTQENAWLHAGAGVIAYAKEIALPLDIIVQPQDTPDAVPFAMGFEDGRCKLVLSMRGNAQAEAILAPLPDSQRGVMIEAMTAHEIGHCWRYVQGEWHVLPNGFVEDGAELAVNPQLLEESKTMRETRREEGFADLVALAWTRQHHAAQYGQVFAWLEQVRHQRPAVGGSHDTLAWLALVKDGSTFSTFNTPFEEAGSLWRKGLIEDK
ncbi:hypothetical protein AAKU55_000696 [Oxalobacteraceae bacterium GrIS 1.11]